MRHLEELVLLNNGGIRQRARGNRFTIACCLVPVALFWAVSAHAATYYVDIASGDDGNAGSSLSAPWQHLPGTVGFTGSGWKVLQDGDSVYVKGGSNNPVQVRFGSPWYNGAAKFDSINVIGGQWDTPAWGSGQPVFDEQNTRSYGFGLDGPGITVDGFEIKNIAAASNSGVAGNGSACIEIGTSATYVKIRRSWLHDAIRTGDDIGHGIEFSTGAGPQVIIEYNEIGPAIGTKGIEPTEFGGGYGVIRYNFLHNSGDHEMTISSDHWDVYGNLIWHVANTSGNYVPWDHEPNYGIKVTGSYVDLWNNVLIGDQNATTFETCGFGFSLPNGGSGGTGIRFVHNSVYGFRGTGNYGESGVNLVMGIGNTATVDSVASNNLLINSRNAQGNIQVHWYNGTVNGTFDHNDLWGGVSGSENVVSYGTTSAPPAYALSAFQGLVSGATNNQQTNPVLTGGTLPTGMDSNYHPNTPYFALTGASPTAVKTTNNQLLGDAIHGYSSSPDKFATDILGNPRSAWSMGAYEFVPGTPSSPCDVNGDGSTNVSDVQLCVNQSIGAAACTTGDINKDGVCNVIDVQRDVNAALGGQCVTQ